jgi:hypothetical protein
MVRASNHPCRARTEDRGSDLVSGFFSGSWLLRHPRKKTETGSDPRSHGMKTKVTAENRQGQYKLRPGFRGARLCFGSAAPLDFPLFRV